MTDLPANQTMQFGAFDNPLASPEEKAKVERICMKGGNYFSDDIEFVLRYAMGNVTATAKMLGIPRWKLVDAINKDPKLVLARDELREEMLDRAESNIFFGVLAGEAKDTHFVLKTLGKERGYVPREEVTGKNGGAQEMQIDVATLSPEEREALRKAIIARKTE